jgi:hypothetical protein
VVAQREISVRAAEAMSTPAVGIEVRRSHDVRCRARRPRRQSYSHHNTPAAFPNRWRADAYDLNVAARSPLLDESNGEEARDFS